MLPFTEQSLAKQKYQFYYWPMWVFNIFTKQKNFTRNPILRSKFLNLLGLHVFRLILSNWCTKIRRLHLFYLIPKEDRASFKRHGFLIKENFLPIEEYNALKKLCSEAKDYDSIGHDGDTKNYRFSLKRLCEEHNLTVNIFKNKKYYNLLRYTAAKDCNFRFFANRLITGQTDIQTNLHTDTYHPTMKSWLYLHDVTKLEDGPFCYYPGSHKLSLKRIILEYKISNNLFSNMYPEAYGGSCRYTDKMVAELSLTEPKYFTVKENTLVIADTFGIHKRTPSRPGNIRTSINVTYRDFWPFSIFPGFLSKFWKNKNYRLN